VAPDDMGAWGDVSNVVPTGKGAYATADVYTSLGGQTATGETAGSLTYAFTGAALGNATRTYVVGTKIWEVVSGSFTDRTNGQALPTMMAQYGNITIAVSGAVGATSTSSGGNFSALAGAPKGAIVLTQSNCVLMFNTDSSGDGWAASDVGDYTNWSTGEAASGRLIQTAGNIVAAVPWRGYVYAFKNNSIYRGQYVGGVIKWSWELLGLPMGVNASLSGSPEYYSAVACKDGIAFISYTGFSRTDLRIHYFDGINTPVWLNPETLLQSSELVGLSYDATNDVLVVSCGGTHGTVQSFYSFRDNAWGKATTAANCVFDLTTFALKKRPPAYLSGTDTIARFEIDSAQAASSTSYVETMKIGARDKKTVFRGVTPILRTRSNRSSGSPAMSLTYSMFSQPHDTAAQSTATVAESSQGQWFDFTANERAATFRVTFTDMYAEIDDVLIDALPAGKH
jgi:hypothetical protein